jgi:4-hydroxybenzoate polyprenyltransferase
VRSLNVLKTIRHLLELIRFSHTLFALPFAMLAAVMAWHLTFEQVREYNWFVDTTKNLAHATPMLGHEGPGHDIVRQTNQLHTISEFRFADALGVLLCMIAARSFAMAFNRLADRRIDAGNPRTAGRHLPAGILSVTQVSTFALVCAVAFVASTLLFLPNRLPLYLSIPVLAFLAGYSFAKRFTALAHFWLGTALALSPVAAWIAIRGNIVMDQPSDLQPALVLGAAVLTWVAGFDIIYACQDHDIDVAAGHYSIPARLGIPNSLRLAAFCHLLTIVALACLPLVYPLFGTLYWLAIVAVAILLIYEHALVRPNDLSRVNAAFFNVNAIISLGLFAAGTLDLLLHRVGY